MRLASPAAVTSGCYSSLRHRLASRFEGDSLGPSFQVPGLLPRTEDALDAGVSSWILQKNGAPARRARAH